jgi:23S rRNA (uracil1939-C5)-methyltransferase
LFEINAEDLASFGHADKWLIDPPREGAFALIKALVALLSQLNSTWCPPTRIVYISCNPATLARDADLLVNHAGYECTAVGMVNMFPHTAHVESMAVFNRSK